MEFREQQVGGVELAIAVPAAAPPPWPRATRRRRRTPARNLERPGDEPLPRRSARGWPCHRVTGGHEVVEL